VEGVRGGAAAPGEYRKIQNYVVNSATGETIYTPPPGAEPPGSRIVTYDILIKRAREAYSAYLQVTKAADRLDRLFE